MKDLGNGDLKKMQDANIVIHVIYKTSSLDRTKTTIIDKYLNGGGDMMTNQVALDFTGAPSNILIDLKTMKIMASDIDHDAAIAACSKL